MGMHEIHLRFVFIVHRRIDNSRMRAAVGRPVRVGFQRRTPEGTLHNIHTQHNASVGPWGLGSS